MGSWAMFIFLSLTKWPDDLPFVNKSQRPGVWKDLEAVRVVAQECRIWAHRKEHVMVLKSPHQSQ